MNVNNSKYFFRSNHQLYLIERLDAGEFFHYRSFEGSKCGKVGGQWKASEHLI